MSDQYYVANIRSLIDRNNPAYAGEESLSQIISSFSCPPNFEVESFLKKSAILFTKKSQSVTYLVFKRPASKKSLVGYFTLAIKPISVRASSISRTMGKKLARVSALNPDDGTYTAAAYLIAQIGKNFSLPKSERIKGAELLDLANRHIERTQYDFGGVVEFLECENSPFLLDFYAENGFKAFDYRMTIPLNDEEPHKLIQLLRFI